MIQHQEIEWNTEFYPFPFQVPLFQAVKQGIKRFVLVWPRRVGKDLCLWNLLLMQASLRKGLYLYFFPTYRLAKKVIWDGMDEKGKRYLEYIPEGLVDQDGFNESELQITYRTGSIIQLSAADSIDKSALGTNCMGAVFSEFAIQDPLAWHYVRPILAKNGGFAAFAYTLRGRNHGYELMVSIKDLPTWFLSKLTAEDCKDWQGNRLITDAMIQQERDAGMPEELIQQEFYTSAEGYQQGSFFADQLRWAEKEERITEIPWIPSLPCYSVSDLGVDVKFATWIYQRVRDKIHWIRYFVLDSGAIPEFAKQIREYPYVFERFYAPFDIKIKDIGTGMQRIEMARKLGIHFTPIKKVAIADRVEAARRILPASYFDKKNCAKGLDALRNYRREWDEDKREYTKNEVHDWASHGGSAFCYGGVALRDLQPPQPMGTVAEMAFDPFNYETTKNKDYDMEFNPFEDEKAGFFPR